MRNLIKILILFLVLALGTACSEKVFTERNPELSKSTDPGDKIPILIDDEEETSDETPADEDTPQDEDTPNDGEEEQDGDMNPNPTPTPNPGDDDDDMKHPGKKHPKHGDDDDSDDDDSDDSDDDQDDNDDDQDLTSGCSKAPLNDLGMHITRLEFTLAGKKKMSIDVGETMNLSQLQQGIGFDSSESGNVRDLKVIVDISQSHVESSDGNLYELSAPSHPHRMLKVKMRGKRQMKQGAYILELNLDLDKNLVQNKNKCFFKPVIHNSKLHEDN